MAGVIILAAAPCTAMVFVWSYLTDGDPAYTLVQVAVNDLLMLVLFVPVVGLLLGVSGVPVSYQTLVLAVTLFVVLPLVVASILRRILIASHGLEWFNTRFVAIFQPITVVALLVTLVVIFAFQAENITEKAFFVVLIAIPILIQVYFQFKSGVRPDETVQGTSQCCRPRRPDRSQQFFRAGGGHGHRPVRSRLRGGPGHGGRSTGGGAGDAFRLRYLQPHPPLV